MAEYTVKEKMEHAIAEAAASFMTNEYVVKGAQLKCTLGSAPSLLNLPLCHGFYATGHPIIHSMDNKPMVNILPFGTCPVLGGPCVPAPVGPWLNTHDKTMIADAAPGGPLYPAVTMKSFLVCALGGLIEPKKCGQEYKAPGSSSTYEGKAPANTGKYDDSSKKPAGHNSIDEWKYLGKNGAEFSWQLPDDIENIEMKFGEELLINASSQKEVELWLVDRIARVLYEELAYSTLSMDCIAWCMFNRMYVFNNSLQYRPPDQEPISLYDVVTMSGQYEVFGTNANYSVAMNPKSPTNTDIPYWDKGWQHALYNAKALVSIACNPYFKTEAEKRSVLEEFIPCPFKPGVQIDNTQVLGVKGPMDYTRITHHVGARLDENGNVLRGWSDEHENLDGWIKVGNNGEFEGALPKELQFQGFYARSDDPYTNYGNL